MKQYLLIPIEEIDCRIEELEKERFYGSELNSDYRIGQQKTLKDIKSKGEIVEIEELHDDEPIGLFTGKDLKNNNRKLIKTINNDNRKSIKRN